MSDLINKTMTYKIKLMYCILVCVWIGTLQTSAHLTWKVGRASYDTIQTVVSYSCTISTLFSKSMLVDSSPIDSSSNHIDHPIAASVKIPTTMYLHGANIFLRYKTNDVSPIRKQRFGQMLSRVATSAGNTVSFNCAGKIYQVKCQII